MFSTGFTSFCVLLLSPLLITFYHVMQKAFDTISSSVDEILSINPSANVFVCGDFNVHHKDWLTYSGGIIDLVNSVTIFLFQATLLRWLTSLL